MAETEAERKAREALEKVASEPPPNTAQGWDDYGERYRQAQRGLGRALGEQR
jgi:hypothetical protein